MLGSTSSVSVQVMLSVSGNVVIEPDRLVRATFEDPQNHRISDKPSAVRFQADEDVRVGHAGNRTDVFPGAGGHVAEARPAFGDSRGSCEGPTASASWSLGW